ncbi:UNVERIFIED_CONTAM: hypothetical protein FKN15_048665 [Acipenser sinensis]
MLASTHVSGGALPPCQKVVLAERVQGLRPEPIRVAAAVVEPTGLCLAGAASVEGAAGVSGWHCPLPTREMAKILNHPRVYAFLHVPVQSASDSVLMDMKREYCVADFRRVVEFLKEKKERCNENYK